MATEPVKLPKRLTSSMKNIFAEWIRVLANQKICKPRKTKDTFLPPNFKPAFTCLHQFFRDELDSQVEYFVQKLLSAKPVYLVRTQPTTCRVAPEYLKSRFFVPDGRRNFETTQILPPKYN